jgi:glycosyltransferase involved in cell wall biosynthesis
MSIPSITVVIPVYNHEEFVERAIISATQQYNCRVQLVIIDDGSTDGSFAKICELSDSFPTGSIFFTRENRGAHTTINEGLSLASGEYLTILNSDDVYFDNRLAIIIEEMRERRALFGFSEVEYLNNKDQIVTNDPYVESLRIIAESSEKRPSLSFSLLQNNLAITTGNFVFHRSLYKKVGPFLHYRYVHDWDYILRCAFYEEPLLVKGKLYGYRVHGTNTFKSLADIAGYETGEVMRNCMHLRRIAGQVILNLR